MRQLYITGKNSSACSVICGIYVLGTAGDEVDFSAQRDYEKKREMARKFVRPADCRDSTVLLSVMMEYFHF